MRTGDMANGQGRNTTGCLRLLQNHPVTQSLKACGTFPYRKGSETRDFGIKDIRSLKLIHFSYKQPVDWHRALASSGLPPELRHKTPHLL